MEISSKINVKVIIGSTRQNRFSEHPARWIYEEARKLPDAVVELIDLRDYPLPFFNEPMPPSMLKGNYSNEVAKTWAAKVAEGDAYIVVAPEYNHGYPAVLKNALDYAYSEWNNKPIGFVSYGTVSGVRSVEQLRQVAIELQMVPVRNAVHIPSFWTLLDEGGKLKPGAFDAHKESAKKFLDQLIWWARALRTARNH
ncbi:MAG: NAD(P)H-dependent oxidoreductase [Parcubacteria group bacterium]|nr:NAD(P)H-dependent oxidoreductase [Parcubacteria group bacterium]